MSLNPLLPEALTVLDRADRLAQAAEAAQRQQLRALVRSSSAHPTEVLDQALTEHLAAQATPPSPLLPAASSVQASPPSVALPSGFRWGWRRPASPQACARRLGWRQQIARWRPSLNGLHWTVGGLLSAGILAFFLTMVVSGAGPHSLIRTDPRTAVPLLMVMAFMLAVVFCVMLNTMDVFTALHAWKRPAELEPDDLPKRMGDYLAHAECRDYLRQVLQSPMPVLLGGDVRRLEALRNDLDHQVYLKEMAAEHHRREQARERRAQERAANRPAYLAQLAHALDQADPPSAPSKGA